MKEAQHDKCTVIPIIPLTNEVHLCFNSHFFTLSCILCYLLQKYDRWLGQSFTCKVGLIIFCVDFVASGESYLPEALHVWLSLLPLGYLILQPAMTGKGKKKQRAFEKPLGISSLHKMAGFLLSASHISVCPFLSPPSCPLMQSFQWKRFKTSVRRKNSLYKKGKVW